MSPSKSLSYMSVESLSTDGTLQIFARAKEIQSSIFNKQDLEQSLKGRQVALVFSEASTRTKMSFQIAAQRLGANCLVVDHIKSSSMSKGETFEDTFWTLHSIRPDLFVVRCGQDEPLVELSEKTQVPIINGGFGSKSHPTQALLDAFTIQEHFGSVKGKKILLVGDILHSRVAESNFKLLSLLGAELAVCGPKQFLSSVAKDIKIFSDLSEAVSWCDVYMGLRVQFERHSSTVTQAVSKAEYIKSYSLNKDLLRVLSKDAVILHPGPVNWGVEFQEEVKADLRLLMWKQKENGVFIRAALMESIVKEPFV